MIIENFNQFIHTVNVRQIFIMAHYEDSEFYISI